MAAGEGGHLPGRHGGPAGFYAAGIPRRRGAGSELWVVWDEQPLPCAAAPGLAPMRCWGLSPSGGREGRVQTTASSTRSLSLLSPAWQGGWTLPQRDAGRPAVGSCPPALLAQHGLCKAEGGGNGSLRPGVLPGPREVPAVPGITTSERWWRPCPSAGAWRGCGGCSWWPLGTLLCQLPTSVPPGQGCSPVLPSCLCHLRAEAAVLSLALL